MPFLFLLCGSLEASFQYRYGYKLCRTESTRCLCVAAVGFINAVVGLKVAKGLLISAKGLLINAKGLLINAKDLLKVAEGLLINANGLWKVANDILNIAIRISKKDGGLL